MIRIVADEKIPYLKGLLEPFADVLYLPGDEITREIVLQADALLIRTITRCDQHLLQGTRVRLIGTATIGFDHIDTIYCDNHSIHWVNAPGCNAASVCQYICSALLALAEKSECHLQDQTLGIVGVGHVGKLVESLACEIGMKIMLNDPPRERNEGPGKFTALDQLLENSDIISLHVPLNRTGHDKTWHMINKDTLRKMKSSAWLINSARGEIVDTPALKDAIARDESPRLVLDVWENEPQIDKDLLPSVFLATPHIAGYSVEGKANGTAAVVRALGKYFNIPVTNWFPTDIQGPANPEIFLNGKNKTKEEILREAVLHTYSIFDDDRRFRAEPQTFERQRGDYPTRREFPAYHITLQNASPEAVMMLKNLGFIVE